MSVSSVGPGLPTGPTVPCGARARTLRRRDRHRSRRGGGAAVLSRRPAGARAGAPARARSRCAQFQRAARGRDDHGEPPGRAASGQAGHRGAGRQHAGRRPRRSVVRESSRPHAPERGGAATRQRERSAPVDDRSLARPAAEEARVAANPRRQGLERPDLPAALRRERRARAGDRRRDDRVALLSRARVLRPGNLPGAVRSQAARDRDERHRRHLQRGSAPASPRAHRSPAGRCRPAERRPLPRRGPQGAHGRRVAGRSVSAVRHADRRPERRRAPRAPARLAGPSSLLGLVEPHAHGCAPHRGHRGSAGRPASAHPSLPVRLLDDVGQRHRRPQARMGGAGIPLRAEHGAAQHRRPWPLHARLDAREVPGPAGGRHLRLRDLRARKVDQPV